MEHFLAIFLGAWMTAFGVFFLFVLNREFAKYNVNPGEAIAGEKRGGDGQ